MNMKVRHHRLHNGRVRSDLVILYGMAIIFGHLGDQVFQFPFIPASMDLEKISLADLMYLPGRDPAFPGCNPHDRS